ncbi:MAG TPA: hypothetical protein VHY58_02855 [Streptosporangiaceae bacterium]|jgi:cation diffusion facilitator CzcD-associated flavoprotein CzcO|nr:hypothetical protein [Streptosporangiaceae bacterium]
MTATVEPAQATADVTSWLARFEDALTSGDAEAAVALFDHMPYLKFPANWPVFSPKDKIADWLESYTKIMELNYWANCEAKSASYDAAAAE